MKITKKKVFLQQHLLVVQCKLMNRSTAGTFCVVSEKTQHIDDTFDTEQMPGVLDECLCFTFCGFLGVRQASLCFPIS